MIGGITTTMNLFQDDDQKPVMIHDYMGNCDGLFSPALLSDKTGLFSKAHDQIIVDINIELGMGGFGNLMDDVPNIEVFAESTSRAKPVLKLTWKEARQLCAALWQVTNIAEFG